MIQVFHVLTTSTIYCNLWYSSKATGHMQIKHMQLIGRKHLITSTRIGMHGRKNLPTLFLQRARTRAKKALQRVFTQVNIFFLQWLCMYTCHFASFLYSILCAIAACIAMPHLDIDTSRRVVFLEFSWRALVIRFSKLRIDIDKQY